MARRLTKYLLDSGSASDLINDRGRIRERADQALARGQRIGICTPVLGELWAGVENSKSKKRNQPLLVKALTRLVVWPFNEAAARDFGRIHAELRRLGRPIGQIDMQIAAVAVSLGNCGVVTKDKHFLAVPGLHVEDGHNEAETRSRP